MICPSDKKFGGGMLPTGVVVGTFTPTETVYQYTINHNLSYIPYRAFAYDITQLPITVPLNIPADASIWSVALTHNNDDTIGFSYNVRNANGNGTNFDNVQISNYPSLMDEQQVIFGSGRYYGGKYVKNRTYLYIIY